MTEEQKAKALELAGLVDAAIMRDAKRGSLTMSIPVRHTDTDLAACNLCDYVRDTLLPIIDQQAERIGALERENAELRSKVEAYEIFLRAAREIIAIAQP